MPAHSPLDDGGRDRAPGAEILLHPADEVSGEGLEVSHLGSILRPDDEPEVMPVVLAALCERYRVSAVPR
jgi:hypothetical protein